MSDTTNPSGTGGAGTNESGERWKYGITAVIAGVVAILIAFGLALWRFQTAADIGAVLGVVISPIAAIVSAYFGVQAGSAGKAAADENARKNVAAGAGLAAANTPQDVQEAVRNLM